VILHGNPGFWVLPQTYADRCDMVDVDNAGGIRQALELLARHGHRTAGFVGQEALKGSERYEAFVRFAPQIGIATRPEWQIGEEDIPLETLRGAVGRIMGGTAHPTAFVCSHDGAALSLLDVLQELGLRCPDAISVVGFGNDNVNGNGKGSILTTIDIQCDKQVAVMLRLLGKQFAGVRDNPEHVRVPAVLVNRGTVAAPGGRAVEAAASR
jgi:LacI family transcriptional regulator